MGFRLRQSDVHSAISQPQHPSKVQIEPYLDLLKKELAMYAKTKYVKTSVFDEIVLGGGTPSVLALNK